MEAKKIYESLDMLCFEQGTKTPLEKGNKKDPHKIEDPKKNTIVIQKSLGVLQENGVFAFVLYLGSEGAFKEGESKEKDEERIARTIVKNVCELLRKKEIGLLKDNFDIENQNQVISAFKSLGETLDTLFFAKTLIEKTLIYALYRAKAVG